MSQEAAATALVIVCLVLTGCGNAGEPSTSDGHSLITSTDTLQTSQAAASPSAAESEKPEGMSVPAPDAAHRNAYLKGLELADPRLISDPDQAVENGRNGCLDIKQQKPGRTQITNMQQRFSAQVTDMNPLAAQAVLAAARAYICPEA
ncbi:hypothetical protein [Streptomyces sp. NPDC057403]|uniref:hypothetical protein n=1 Tax=Streptomyces sp. NPDC057403 TaxID=3346119 RepID=UPI003686590F